MKSNLQESNGLDAIFESTRQKFVWKWNLSILNIFFGHGSDLNEH
jgi:hypothetical protein